MKCAAILSVKTIKLINENRNFLGEFPFITNLPDHKQPVKHRTMRFITTNGPPVVINIYTLLGISGGYTQNIDVLEGWLRIDLKLQDTNFKTRYI